MLGLGHGISTDTPGTGEVFHNNYSILLDGANDYIEVNAAIDDININKGTFSAWCRISGATSINGVVIKASVNSNNQISMAYLNSDEEWQFRYKAGGTDKQITVSTDAETTGAWVNLAMTWDTSADELLGFVNGTQVGETLDGLGEWSGSIDKFYLGVNTLAANSYFKGNIDEVGVWDEVLSASNISTELYSGGKPKDVEFSGRVLGDLVTYWRFTEGTGSSSTGSTASARTANLVHAPVWSTTTV